MSKLTITPTKSDVTITPGEKALIKYLEQNGKFPPVTLSIVPLEDLQKSNQQREIFIDKFISYSFKSSIMVPVDTFNCEIHYEPIEGFRKPMEGDICVLRANGIPIATGIIDQLDMETDGNTGTRLSIQGRDLLGQFEDQDAVSIDSNILWGNKYSVDQVIRTLAKDTRINPNNLIKRYAPKKPYLFATQPGESKLSALQRYCEALDIFFWMDGNGNLIIGKPDMYGTLEGAKKGSFYLLKKSRSTNVLSIRSTRNSTQIPNLIVPIWNGQETVQSRVSKENILENKSAGPARLLALNHRTPKAVIVSTPEGSAPQDLAELNTLLVAGQGTEKLAKAGASTLLQAYAKREMAKANMRDLNVEICVAGHYNDLAEPLQTNCVYRIQYDIDGIDEEMFLYSVEYFMSETEGQRTRLNFCKQTALVSNVRAT